MAWLGGNSKEAFLVKSAILFRAASVFVGLLFDAGFEDYDMSTRLLDPSAGKPSLLKAFNRWDSLFFTEIARKGYQFDKNHVFFPLYPLILDLLAKPLGCLEFMSNSDLLTLAGLILNLVLNCVSVLFFFRFSL